MAVKVLPRLIPGLLLASASRLERKSPRITIACCSSRCCSTAGLDVHERRPMSYTTLKERFSYSKEIKKSKFIAIAAHVTDEGSAQSFLSEVRDPRATHNCWAYKLGDQFRYNDDGEPSGTAGKPMYSAILSSGIDMVMVVVIRYFGGIKLGTGGLVRAYAGVTAECLKDAPTHLVKSKVPFGVEVPFDLLGSIYHQIQIFGAEDVKQDYDTGKDGFTVITFMVNFDKVAELENAIRSNCSRDIQFFKC